MSQLCIIHHCCFSLHQDVNPELSLASAGQVPIPVQEETEHIPSPLALGNATNTCFVSGRVLHRPAMERDTSDCCEVRVYCGACISLFVCVFEWYVFLFSL